MPRAWGEAARPSDRQLPARGTRDHRVVAGHVNAPVVTEPGIGNTAEAVACVGIVRDDRLARQVATRHHQHLRAGRVSGQAEQQVVYRRIGDHHADVRMRRRDRIRQPERRVAALRQQHDRSSHRLAGGHFPRRRPRRSSGRSPRSGTITAKGLSPRSLRLRKVGNCGVVARGAGQVIAADSLHAPRIAPASIRRRVSSDRSVAPVGPARPDDARSGPARSPGRRPSGRGIGGRRDRRTRRHTPSTAVARPSSSSAGRTGGQSTTVKRGPQLVQLMKGCRYRRSAGSASSARQASQVAMSGETRVRPGPCRDGSMTNSGATATGQLLCGHGLDVGKNGATPARADDGTPPQPTQQPSILDDHPVGRVAHRIRTGRARGRARRRRTKSDALHETGDRQQAPHAGRLDAAVVLACRPASPPWRASPPIPRCAARVLAGPAAPRRESGVESTGRARVPNGPTGRAHRTLLSPGLPGAVRRPSHIWRISR